MTCDCRKHAPDPNCSRPEHSATYPNMASAEERVRLLRDSLYAMERCATAYLLSETAEERTRTEPLILEAIELAREAL